MMSNYNERAESVLEAPAPALTSLTCVEVKMADYSILPARFWNKVNRNGPIPSHGPELGPCWLWTASYMGAGYGQFWFSGRNRYAHRVAYEAVVGPIPEGLDLDHLCRTHGCVNPAHLEPVTRSVNLLRGNTIPARNARKTHCPHGHPYSGDNLCARANGTRECRACMREAARRRRGQQPKPPA